jgi:hypothetical protein
MLSVYLTPWSNSRIIFFSGGEEKSLPPASRHLSRKSLPPPLSHQAIQDKSLLLFYPPLLYPEGKAS